MTPSLQRRLEALEGTHGAGAEFIIIARHIVDPGQPSGEIAFADLRGQRITRELAESEAAFLARVHALAEASASPGQRCARIVVTETDLML